MAADAICCMPAAVGPTSFITVRIAASIETGSLPAESIAALTAWSYLLPVVDRKFERPTRVTTLLTSRSLRFDPNILNHFDEIPYTTK